MGARRVIADRDAEWRAAIAERDKCVTVDAYPCDDEACEHCEPLRRLLSPAPRPPREP
jgi:hypothetical protein